MPARFQNPNGQALGQRVEQYFYFYPFPFCRG
nr:MAG TPA: hypothetical protein [Caudoviricetes sp.]